MDKGIDPLCKINGNAGVSACNVTIMVKMGLSNIFMKMHVTTKHPITGLNFWLQSLQKRQESLTSKICKGLRKTSYVSL